MAEPQENWFAANAPPAASTQSIRRDARGMPISESNPAEDRPIASWIGHLVDSIRNPTPGQQLAMDVLPIATGAIGNKLGNPVQGPEHVAAKVADTRAAIAPFAETVIAKKLGLDPEAIQLQAARLKLAAARSQTRQGRLAAEIAKIEQSAASAPTAAPPESAGGGTAPPAGPLAAAAPVSAPPPATPAAAASKAMLSAPEVLEFDKLRAAGKTETQAWNAIRAAREIREKFGLTIPTKAETQFPKGWRGKTTPPSE